jgi:hypothetical protein
VVNAYLARMHVFPRTANIYIWYYLGHAALTAEERIIAWVSQTSYLKGISLTVLRYVGNGGAAT